MSKQLTILICCILGAQFSFASGNTGALWQKANNYYETKAYDSAVYYYDKIASAENASSELYYNMANSYYRLNDIGKAVLYYERALKYNPSDKRIADNLYLANGRINNRIQGVPQIFFIRWWKNITQSTNSNTFAIISILLFLITMAYHILKRIGTIKFQVPVQATIAAIAIAVIFAILGLVSGQRMVDSKMAVVLEEGTPFMKQPKYGTSQSLIPAGTKIEVTDLNGVWYEVILPDGRTGWLQKTDVEKI